MSVVYIWAAFCLGWCVGGWWAGSRLLRRRNDQIDRLFDEQFKKRVHDRLYSISRN